MVKRTFTLDEQAAEALRRAAARLNKPQSAVVREAIQDYASRTGCFRLGEDERKHMLGVIDRMMARASERTQAAVNAEIRWIRVARKTGGRRTKSE
jgi:hypothetical protein